MDTIEIHGVPPRSAADLRQRLFDAFPLPMQRNITINVIQSENFSSSGVRIPLLRCFASRIPTLQQMKYFIELLQGRHEIDCNTQIQYLTTINI